MHFLRVSGRALGTTASLAIAFLVGAVPAYATDPGDGASVDHEVVAEPAATFPVLPDVPVDDPSEGEVSLLEPPESALTPIPPLAVSVADMTAEFIHEWSGINQGCIDWCGNYRGVSGFDASVTITPSRDIVGPVTVTSSQWTYSQAVVIDSLTAGVPVVVEVPAMGSWPFVDLARADDGSDRWLLEVVVETGAESSEPGFRVSASGFVTLLIHDRIVPEHIWTPEVSLDSDVVKPGDVVGFTGRSFQVGEDIVLALPSGPIPISATTVGIDGTVTGSFVVPEDMAEGTHALSVTGVTSGLNSTASLQVTVPVGAPKPKLAETGDASLSLAVLALGALAVGAALLGVRRASER